MESRTQWSKDFKREKDVQFNTAANLRVVDIKEIKFSKVMIRNKKYRMQYHLEFFRTPGSVKNWKEKKIVKKSLFLFYEE